MSTESPEDFCVCGARRKAHLAPFSGCGNFEPFEGPKSRDIDQEVRALDKQLDQIIDPSPPVDVLRGSRFKPELAAHGSASAPKPVSYEAWCASAPMAEPTDAARIEQAAFERGRVAERARLLGEDPNKTASKAIVADVLGVPPVPAPRMSWALKVAREALKGAAWSNGPTLRAITAAILQAETTGYERAIAVLREHDAPIARACANMLEKSK